MCYIQTVREQYTKDLSLSHKSQQEPSNFLDNQTMAFSSRRTDPSSSTSLTEIPSHFFKVILPATIEEKKMRIPEKFVRRFGDELSDVASLRDPNGQVWHVKLVRDGKEIWFHDGLHDFVEYHSICVGHFLVFKYSKNSNFHVLVFDKTACEVQYPDYCEELNDEKNSAQRDEMKIDNSVEVMGCRTPNPSSSSLRSKGTYRCMECGASVESKTTMHLNDPDSSTQDEHEEEVCRFSESSSATKRTATTEERERVIEAAKAFEPANPFCSVVMRSTYVQKWCFMFLPACFSAKHLKRVSGIIKLQLSDGKQWPVHCQYRGGRAKLGKGWYEFTLENNLGEGDVCVFEMLRSRDIVLKVTVFRVLETAESVNRVSFVSALGKNRCRKCVAYLETTPKHVHDSRSSKRCKIEEVEMVDNSDVVGDVSELRKTANKVVTHSSDGKNKSKYDDDEVLALLKDKGIFVKQNFRKIAAEAKERVINIVRYLKPKNPSFIVIFQSRSSDRYSLYVPAEFASKCFSRDVKIIKLQVSDGREWPVQLFWRHNDSADIITGWSAFSKENNLNEGDVCLFELIRKEDFLLKVSVFHSCD